MSADGDGAAYLPFEGGRFRLALGLMALPWAEWLEIDRRLAADLAAKRALLETRRGEVFAEIAALAHRYGALVHCDDRAGGFWLRSDIDQDHRRSGR